MSLNSALATTLQDHLAQLGDIAPDRVRMQPAPGTATAEECIALNELRAEGLYEWVDGTLVEKAMSYEASVVALTIARIVGIFVANGRLGLLSGPDGFFRLASVLRGPDVAFVDRKRLPGGKFPAEACPTLVPDFVVEVLSPGNTKAELARKRIEYFAAGTQLVWIVDCAHRSVAVYTSPSDAVVVGQDAVIDGGNVFKGFSSPVADFFADLDIGA
ncbi:MAG: Uma2 family endonuclease [Pirellulaceae bacterium]